MHCALPNSDLIVSDVTAGLVLLRRFQRLRQKLLVSEVVLPVLYFATA